MDRVKDYLARAEEARRAAIAAQDQTVKEGFLKIAQEYTRMADRISRADK